MIIDKFQEEGLGDSIELAAETQNLEVMKDMVENSDSLSFMTMEGLKGDIDKGRFRIVNLKENLTVTFCALVRRDIYLHPLVGRLISMCRQAFGYTPNSEIRYPKLVRS